MMKFVVRQVHFVHAFRCIDLGYERHVNLLVVHLGVYRVPYDRAKDTPNMYAYPEKTTDG